MLFSSIPLQQRQGFSLLHLLNLIFQLSRSCSVSFVNVQELMSKCFTRLVFIMKKKKKKKSGTIKNISFWGNDFKIKLILSYSDISVLIEIDFYNVNPHNTDLTYHMIYAFFQKVTCVISSIPSRLNDFSVIHLPKQTLVKFFFVYKWRYIEVCGMFFQHKRFKVYAYGFPCNFWIQAKFNLKPCPPYRTK